MQEIIEFCVYGLAIATIIGGFITVVWFYVNILFWCYHKLLKIRSDYLVNKAGNEEYIVDKYKQIKAKISV